MSKTSRVWTLGWLVALWLLAQPALAAEGMQGRLVSAAWLAQNLARTDLRILDASPAQLHRQQHIPGAVNADMFLFGPQNVPLAEIERRLRGWGISAGAPIVIYDQGGTYMATRLFWDLLHHGVPARDLYLLDGGMARWLAQGGAVTKEPTPAPAPGTVRVTGVDESVRVRLPEFLAATGDAQHNVMLEALDPSYYFGGAAFFDRGGHVPNATLMPSEDFYNADKTFKSAAEIRQMLDHLGIRPDQQVLTYCGGGGAAAVPFFALRFIVDYPRVKLYQESQLGWLQDERELPVWTYAAPYLARDTPWLKAWGSPMLKAFGLSRVSIVDVRAPEVFKLGHLPLAVNVPASVFEALRHDPARLAATLGEAGVDPTHEVVIVSEGGLNAQSALAFVLLESLGQARVSIFLDSVERWAELGQTVARPEAKAGAAAPRKAPAIAYAARTGANRLIDPTTNAAGAFPRVYVANGERLPAGLPASLPPGRVVPLPPALFLAADGRPKAAKEIWPLLAKAGVPRYAEHVLVADTLGEAALNYVVLRMMGLADLKVLAP